MVAPKELLVALDAARPVCKFYLTKKGCKQGSSCKLRHGESDDVVNAYLPHVSRHDGPEGTTITLRPPLPAAIQKFFGAHNFAPIALGASRATSRKQLLCYQLLYMQEPDAEACRNADTSGYAKDGQGKWVGKSGSVSIPYPTAMCHGTSVEKMLQILLHGSIKPGPGIAGDGVYGFGVEVEDGGSISEEEMLKAWDRCVTGGYVHGAAIFFKCKPGILVKGRAKLALGPGMVSYKKDQLAAHPSVMQYDSVLVDVECLVAALGRYLDSVGYTATLHKCLMNIRDYMDKNKQVSHWPASQDMVPLRNPAVSSGRHHQTSFGTGRGRPTAEEISSSSFWSGPRVVTDVFREQAAEAAAAAAWQQLQPGW